MAIAIEKKKREREREKRYIKREMSYMSKCGAAVNKPFVRTFFSVNTKKIPSCKEF